MAFPVDMLNSYSHEDLESSGEDYLSNLRCRNPNHPDFLSLPDHGKIPISLSTVGFVPLYGGEQTHKVLALFAPEDSITAVALYLADQWWSIDDIVRTSIPARQGLHQVKSVGERVVLYVLNRIIYRKQEIERNEVPFLCHGSNDYAKIMWKKGEAIGFYSVKPKGSVCRSYRGQNYKLPVLDTMFVRKKHRGKDSGLIMLEDFVDSFTEDALGLRYPLSPFMYTGNCNVQGKHSSSVSNPRGLCHLGNDTFWKQCCLGLCSGKKHNSFFFLHISLFFKAYILLLGHLPALLLRTFSYPYPNIAPISIRTRSSHLKRPRIGRNTQESEPETSQGDEENALHVSESRIYLNTCCRLELPAHIFESSEDLVEESGENAVENDEEMIVENEDRSVSEMELHASPPEKWKTLSEPLNGEVTEEIGKTSLMAEEETPNEVLGGESKLQSESQGEESLTLFVPLILESPAKPSEDTVSKVLNANNSEVITEESASAEEGTEEQQESEKTTTENAAASASKEEHSDNGLPNSVLTEAAEESISENLSTKTASSLEDQNEEAGHNSQEASVALSQSSLIVVELEGVSFQQPPGQEGQKNQLEEHSEESAEPTYPYTQTAAERAADSSSEEAEIEVPIVDRRNLRRKAKGFKGPPKKKGKPA
ncbi:F169A protein, partial [Ardeotis kori]|nr:F169A protein [Ardeotis kori]